MNHNNMSAEIYVIKMYGTRDTDIAMTSGEGLLIVLSAETYCKS